MAEVTDKVSNMLVFYVNGHRISIENPDPAVTLLEYLRDTLGLTGAKAGCAEGGCGTCTVMLSRCDQDEAAISHYTVVACLTSIAAIHGLAVTTIEAIGSTRTKLHVVQERLAEAHGSQCGYCSPGMVMSMYTLLRNDARPSPEQVELAITGNLCRCTGYRPIIAAFSSFSETPPCTLGEECCRVKISNGSLKQTSLSGLDNNSKYLPYDPSQEPIFPPALQRSGSLRTQSLMFVGEHVTWCRPTSLAEALTWSEKYSDSVFVGGGTVIGGIEKTIKFQKQNQRSHNLTIIDTTGIHELRNCVRTSTCLTIGSAVTLRRMLEEISSCAEDLHDEQCEYLRAFKAILLSYASPQIRNVATLGGAVAKRNNGLSSDLLPLVIVTSSRINLANENTTLIRSVEVPFSKRNDYCRSYKVSDRRDVGLSYVTAAFRVTLEEGTGVVRGFSAAYGSADRHVFVAEKTKTMITGRPWAADLLESCLATLRQDMADHWAGQHDDYQVALVTSLFFRFFSAVTAGKCQEPNQETERSAIAPLLREPSRGTQVFEEVSASQAATDALRRPLVHLSSLHQVTGEAVYCDDIPSYKNELHIAFVTSKYARANILSVDSSVARGMPGVRAFITHEDIPGKKKLGVIFKDEEVFASTEVAHCGQVIAAVVADSPSQARQAASNVSVKYEELPAILTIEDAIVKQSFLSPVKEVKNCHGDVEAGFASSDVIIEGSVKCGSQEHMTMERMAAVCAPSGEHQELTIYSNTQGPTGIQKNVIEALDVPANRVVVKVKRIGGSFGSRDTRNYLICVPVAVAALKLNKPVRCVLSREDEIRLKGGRHSVLAKYKVGFSKDGRIIALSSDIFFNCGHSNDVSLAVADYALTNFDNGYLLPHLSLTAHLCRTNLHSSTSFRGFGGPQALVVLETILTHMAAVLEIPKHQISALNLSRDGDPAMFGSVRDQCTLRQCWQQCVDTAQFHERWQHVQTFNKENSWKKKGISITPVQFFIGYKAKFMNQGGALVHVYRDGSVLISHGGTEMGQGLHTKMVQVASHVLGVAAGRIHIAETSTDKVANTLNTVGSMSTDLYGAAVMDACQKIKNRLQVIIDASPNKTWDDWVEAAFLERISLSSTGFYKLDADYDFAEHRGRPYWYYTYGAACSEVLLDCLTGEHVLLRTDIVMDVGKSINPAIDIGQIEGAFLQGVGYLTMETVRYNELGDVLSRGPLTYKVPGARDVATRMNVSLLKGSANQKAVYSSKGIGEPPLLLATSVLMAIREAVSAARQHQGITVHFRLDVPATPAKIRLLCENQFL